MITIQQIADLAGVSRRTVDRVLKNRGDVKSETRDKIEQILKEYDYHPSVAAQGLAAWKKKFKIVFCSVRGTVCPIHEETRAGAYEKAEALKGFGVTVDFLTFERDQRVPEREMGHILEEFSCDALAVVPVHMPEVEMVIETAKSMEIPILFYNLDDERFDRLCYIGCNYQQSGRVAAGLAALCTGDKGNISIYSSRVLNSYSYQGRVDGFEKELADHYPQMKILEKVMLEDDQEEYYHAIERTKEQFPQLDLVYLVNPGDYHICEVVGNVFEQQKIRIITNDLLEIQMDMLRRGTISATISQEARRQGSLAIETLFNYLAYGKKPEQRYIYTDLSIYIGQSTYSMEII